MMAKMGVGDIRGLVDLTPGFNGKTEDSFIDALAIRGIVTNDFGIGGDPSVAIFTDGVWAGRTGGVQMAFYDMWRAEVVKGPQSTLFGRNAVGGVINVITSKPTDELSVTAEISGGNEGFARYAGLVSGPITENLLGKISFAHREHDGYLDNIVLGKEQQDEDNDSIRGQLLFTTDLSEWLLSADYMEDDREDMGRLPIASPSSGTDTVQIWIDGGGEFGTVLAPVDGGSDRESGGISLTANIEFESGTLTSITAYRNAETDWQMASIGVARNGSEVIDNIQEEIDTYSQELRWSSSLSGPINYVAGLYYMQEDTDRNEAFELWFAGGMPGATGPFALFGNEISNQSNESTSYAAYIQGDYEFNEQWTLTLGARYTYDEKETESTSVDCGNLPAGFEG
ncbi:MAG: TonB-dependent receptor, partial [Lysobacterales bacterium]